MVPGQRNDRGKIDPPQCQSDRDITLSSGPVYLLDLHTCHRHYRAEVLPRPNRRSFLMRIPVVLLLSCGFLTALAGCSGRSSFLSGGPSVGQLKTSLSHLEYENSQLKRSVAKLEQENRTIEERLVKEQLDNGELIARLDDARNLLRGRGKDQSELAGTRPDERRSASEESSGPRTLPAGRATPKRRKLPVARIPGQIDPAKPRDSEEPSLVPQPIPDDEADRSTLRLDDNLDHHTYYTGQLRWTRMAGRQDDTSSPIR